MTSSPQHIHRKNIAALLVLVLTTGFYIFTLSPSLAWGDGVRLQSEAISGESFILAELIPDEFTPDPFPFSRLGVTAWDHPLYIVLGHTLVKALPSVDPLWLVNLISAGFGAASIVLLFLLCHRFTSSLPAAGYAALALAVSHTFWWHSSTPEVYTLFTFLLLLSLYQYDTFERTGSLPALTLSAFFLGLAMANHILGVLAFPALALHLFLSRGLLRTHIQGRKKLLLPVSGFLTGFSLYILQFLRLSGKFEFSQIFGSAVGSTFLSGLGAFPPAVLAESLVTYLLYLFVQFGPIGVLLGVAGMRKLFMNADPLLKKIAAFYIVYTAFGIFYRVTDQFAFFMTSHVFFALLMGIGAQLLLSSLQQRSRFFLGVLLAFSVASTPFFYRALPRLAEYREIGDDLLGIPQVGPDLRNGLAYYVDPNKRGDTDAYDFGYETLTSLAPDALVIAEWYTDTDEYFVLRYFQRIMGLRPDVTLLGWPTEDPFSFDSALVLGAVQDSFPERPVYLASLSERFYSSSILIGEYCILVESNLYRLHPKESMDGGCLGEESIME